MKYEKYPTTSSASGLQYEFVSVGPKGHILKIIEFIEQQDEEDLYEISFGDFNDYGEIDLLVNSENHDRDKILETVICTIDSFLNQTPDAGVVFKGSTPSRTRLYRLTIAKRLNEFKTKFRLFGFHKDHWISFYPDHDFTSFLVRRKK